MERSSSPSVFLLQLKISSVVLLLWSKSAGAQPLIQPVMQACTETCHYALDGDCDDGGPGNEFDSCAFGTDCIDCGARDIQAPPPASPPLVPGVTCPWACSSLLVDSGTQLSQRGNCGCACTAGIAAAADGIVYPELFLTPDGYWHNCHLHRYKHGTNQFHECSTVCDFFRPPSTPLLASAPPMAYMVCTDGPGTGGNPSWCSPASQCPGWAWDCDTNPGYMHTCCKATCALPECGLPPHTPPPPPLVPPSNTGYRVLFHRLRVWMCSCQYLPSIYVVEHPRLGPYGLHGRHPAQA
eukprot:5243503-Prymnesium_polylepis.1